MTLKKIWLCTSKNSKLHRIFLLHTGDTERKAIYDCFKDDLDRKEATESSIEKLNGNALIDDIPYHINLVDIKVNSYLSHFKNIVEGVIENNPPSVIQFSKNPLKTSEIKNFEENEGIKFIIAQSDNCLYFLQAPNNSIIKNKLLMTLSITENSSVVKVPKGIQIPSSVTAKLTCSNNKLYVYDVNKFESMLTLNENQKAKSQAVLNKFIQGQYKISAENYTFSGLDSHDVQQKLHMSSRAMRRLAKYQPSGENYTIEQIKLAVNKLDPELQVIFDDHNRIIKVNEHTAKTFVGIIHNSIILRLISGKPEILL